MALVRSGSYGHKIVYERPDEYVLIWTTDSKYMGSRLRFSRGWRRDTNRRGAERFAKKWSVAMPLELTP